MGKSSGEPRRRLRCGAALALGIGMIAAATPALAQEPAICGQYAGLPQCVADEGGSGGNGGPGTPATPDPLTDSEHGAGGVGDEGGAGGPGDLASGADAAGSVASAGGELPFTGYPLTPLVWLLLAVLVAGVCLRAHLTVRARLRARSDAELA